jgi:hypothetical protein
MEGTLSILKRMIRKAAKKYIRKKYYYNRGSGFHGLKNIGDSPLIIFVITTNE